MSFHTQVHVSWFGVQCSSSCCACLCLNHNSFDLFGAQLTHSLCLCLSVSPLLLTFRGQVKGTRCSVLFTTQTDGYNRHHALTKCAKCSIFQSVSQSYHVNFEVLEVAGYLQSVSQSYHVNFEVLEVAGYLQSVSQSYHVNFEVLEVAG